MSLYLVTDAVREPLTLPEVKDHLRITETDQDDVLMALIHLARVKLDGKDGILGRALMTQTWDLYLDHFPATDGLPIRLPLNPVQSITSITYTDTDGNAQTWGVGNYTVDIYSEPAEIYPAYAKSWPSTRDVVNAVKVRFVAGYGDNAYNVPPPVLQAMKLIIGHYYENREDSTTLDLKNLPRGVDALLAPYRIRRF